MEARTLWEYYAGQALQGFFSGFPFTDGEFNETDRVQLQKIAGLCGMMATEMVRESLKKDYREWNNI